MSHLFVTGMLRSGTTLVQRLLSANPSVTVAYQPFHQLYVDVKTIYLEQHGLSQFLPLGDGMDQPAERADHFLQWIANHEFPLTTATQLWRRATTGKGGGAAHAADRLDVRGGTFMDMWKTMHAQLPTVPDAGDAKGFRGSKEILCEEFIPVFDEAGVRSVIVIRDPRAVITSASFGSYRAEVGDRYPLLMLIRLWRKSFAHWSGVRSGHPALAIRYEDIVTAPDDSLDSMARALEVEAFPRGLADGPLKDPSGRAWTGNSSFGHMSGIDSSSLDAWRTKLAPDVAAFVEACTWRELGELGYPRTLAEGDVDGVLSHFVEQEHGVREAYLRHYRLDAVNRERERKHLAREASP